MRLRRVKFSLFSLPCANSILDDLKYFKSSRIELAQGKLKRLNFTLLRRMRHVALLLDFILNGEAVLAARLPPRDLRKFI